MTSITTYLKDYLPPKFMLTTVFLSFDLLDDCAIVSNSTHLIRQSSGDLQLDGDELELISIHMNNILLQSEHYELHPRGLTIFNCPDEFDLTIKTRIRPQDNTALSGLYRSNGLFCTQCEAEGFRRITYFLDRPDVMAIYHTKITADKTKFPILLSNGNLMDSGEEGERHWALWHDPFKKPCYLFALVAGNLACITDTFITKSGRQVDLFIYTDIGHEDQCAHAMHSLIAAMRWDEQEYGREYDLDRFMIVAVRDFNMGAMENKGLNIFNSKYILARPTTATDQDYLGIESVVAHEYFHNWTGNRVTCRDWFQLSLKEGLTVFRDQEFSRDMNSRDVNRISDVSLLRQTQFPEDAGSMSHPVRPESYQEINNFYTATIYNKGAEVIRMQETLLSKEGFRKGMDLYFERHDGQAVTIDDFVGAMESANDVDLTQFKRWYSQAGTPHVEVKSAFKNGQLSLTLTQSCPSTADAQVKKPFHIPIRIALFTKTGEPLPLASHVLELKKETETFSFDGLSEKPLISMLQDFSAPIVLHHAIDEDAQIALLKFEPNGFAKWNIAQNLAISCLVTCYHNDKKTWQVSSKLLDAFRHVLVDTSLDQALRAELLTPPSVEDMMAALVKDIDVARVESVRDFYRKTLGGELQGELQAMYDSLWKEEDHAMHGKAYGRRKLKNLCLWFLMKADEDKYLVLCQSQNTHAQTMTDKIASTTLLINSAHKDIQAKAIDDFYQQWMGNDLVIDKWFSMQANSELPDTLARVKTLLKHPAFDMKNPNKVRSLIGVFCQTNARHFHAIDGSGYRFLTEMLIDIDKINPQIAARLATPLTRGARLDAPRRLLIKQALQTLMKQPLSKDMLELVTKSMVAYD